MNLNISFQKNFNEASIGTKKYFSSMIFFKIHHPNLTKFRSENGRERSVPTDENSKQIPPGIPGRISR